jgi:hypothetical protein
MQPLCDSAIDLPPMCPPTICPIMTPSNPSYKSAHASSAWHNIVSAGAPMRSIRQLPMATGFADEWDGNPSDQKSRKSG